MNNHILKSVMTVVLSFLLILSSMPLMCTSSSNNTLRVISRGNTIIVNASGGGDYTHIRWAISNASEGDTVYVEAGTYYENIYIDKRIKLIGEGENKTILEGNWMNGIVMIMVNDVHISGFTIIETKTNPDYSRGIGLWEANGCWIENNVFTVSQSGIDLDESSNNTIFNNIFVNNNNHGISSNGAYNNTIFDNIFLNNTRGMSMYESDNNIVNDNLFNNNNFGILTSTSKNNNISNNSFMSDGSDIWRNDIWISGGQNNTISKNICQTRKGYGINLEVTTHNIVTGNEMMKNGIYLKGSSIEEWTTHSIDKLNTVNGKPVIYMKNSVGGIVPNGAGQIILANCSSVIVDNQNLSNGLYGLQVGYSSNNTIRNNTVLNNYLSGIYIYESDGNIISNNTCSSNGENGIRLSGSGNHLINNNCNSNGGSGISAGRRRNNISNNICNFNKGNGGIYIWGNDNTISYNICNSNVEIGIHLTGRDNTFSNNSCSYNEDGIELVRSERNSLYKNNCYSNVQSAFVLYESHDNTLDDNYAINNSAAITLDTSKRNTLVYNIMDGCGIYIDDRGLPGDIENWNTQNIDISNLVDGKPVYYLKNETGGIVPPSAGQVILANCTGITVENQNIGNATVGIGVYYSYNNSILNNTCSNNIYDGIKFFNSSKNLVKDNTVTLNNWSAIYLSAKSENNTIDHNTCNSNYFRGIVIGDYWGECNNNIIINNTCSNASYGIHISRSENNLIKSNIIHNNSRYGIVLSRATDNMLNNNNLTENGIQIWGFSLEQWNTHRINITNKVNGKPVYYWNNVRKGNIPKGAGQIILANCSGVNIGNQEISNTSTGIILGFSQNNTIVNNSCKNNLYGIELTKSSNNYIHYNTANANMYAGVSIGSDSDGNIIIENTINYNFGAGLSCYDSSSNIISKNMIFSNEYNGIYYRGELGRIENNNISNNYYGITIERETNSLIIVNNDISNNEKLGLDISRSTENNLIHHNNFVKNNNGGIQARDNGTDNVWNTNTEGNYWSEWTAPDTDEDGIVDYEYLINGTAGTLDRYPVVEPVDKTLPVAYGGQEKLVYEGATVELDGTYSYDDTGIENYTWSLVYDDREVSIYGRKTNFTFEIPGIYEVNLTVTDIDGNEAHDLVIIVVNPLPDGNVPDEAYYPGKEDNLRTALYAVIIAIVLVIFVWLVVRKRRNKMRSRSPEEERMKPK